MALVNILKIAADGFQAEHDPATDEINMLDYQLGGTSLNGTSGSTVLGDDSSTYTNISPAADTIRAALEALDAEVGNQNTDVCNPYTNGNGGAITLGQAVYISGVDTVDLADASSAAADNPIGVVGEASIASAASGLICSEGIVEGALTGATAGDKYFLQNTPGLLGTTVPTGSGNNVVFMGYAKNATDLHLQIQNVGRRF